MINLRADANSDSDTSIERTGTSGSTRSNTGQSTTPRYTAEYRTKICLPMCVRTLRGLGDTGEEEDDTHNDPDELPQARVLDPSFSWLLFSAAVEQSVTVSAGQAKTRSWTEALAKNTGIFSAIGSVLLSLSISLAKSPVA